MTSLPLRPISVQTDSRDGIERWLPSRYTARTFDSERNLILYNSYSGAIGVVPRDQVEEVMPALQRQGFSGGISGLLVDLVDGGFIVPANTDELKRVSLLRLADKAQERLLELIIMPSETCNFRCVYCYESFKLGTMLPGVQRGLTRFVANRADSLDRLTVRWFGGEPTTALEVIDDLSRNFIRIADHRGIPYMAGMTTNAFNLTPDVADLLLRNRVLTYQITIDGPAHHHDSRRKLLGGGGTFETIMQNLRHMSARPDEELFSIMLRVNFDRESKEQIPDLIRMLSEEFGNDRRFQVYFRPIGQWGGANDASLPVCFGTAGEVAMWELHGEAIRQGMPIALLHQNLAPGGMVCYAAQPFSFVFGADGRVYKCTVALDDDSNVVGRLRPDGSISMDDAKLALWLNADESIDPKCTPCFFRPACQGARCPWIRIRDNRTPCPPEKNHLRTVLQLVSAAPAPASMPLDME